MCQDVSASFAEPTKLIIGVLDAFFCQWVGGEETGETLTAGKVPHFFERSKKIDHFAGIVTPLSGVFHTQYIRFSLIIPAELEKQELDPYASGTGDLGKGFTDGTPNGQPELGQHQLAELGHAVAGIDMTQFMRQNHGQLCF